MSALTDLSSTTSLDSAKDILKDTSSTVFSRSSTEISDASSCTNLHTCSSTSSLPLVNPAAPIEERTSMGWPGNPNLVAYMWGLIMDVRQGFLSMSELYQKVSRHSGFSSSVDKGAELYCILCTSFCLVSSGQVAYQRDVYYRYKSLLKSVANVRFLCNKLAFYLSVPPARLYIISSPKGLVCGSISMELTNGTVVNYTPNNGQLMVHASFVHRINPSEEVDTVLVVEKETVFFALVHNGFGIAFPNAILVTGKGYPDTNTREILSRFASTLKVVVLTDCDPDGAHIHQVYVRGSQNCPQYGLSHAKWGGLHCSLTRIGKWGLDAERLLEFTAHDRTLAMRLMHQCSAQVGFRRRVAKMLYRSKKAELEAITQYRAVLLDYVAGILSDHD